MGRSHHRPYPSGGLPICRSQSGARGPGRLAWAVEGASHRAHIGVTPSPSWLATAELHGASMGPLPHDAVQIAAGQGRYAEWVDAGCGAQLWKESLRQGKFLGDQAFIDRGLAVRGMTRRCVASISGDWGQASLQIVTDVAASGEISARSAPLPDPAGSSSRLLTRSRARGLALHDFPAYSPYSHSYGTPVSPSTKRTSSSKPASERTSLDRISTQRWLASRQTIVLAVWPSCPPL